MSGSPYEEGNFPTHYQRRYGETSAAFPRAHSSSGARPLPDPHEAPNPTDRSPGNHRQGFRESYIVSSDEGTLLGDPIHKWNPSAVQYLPHLGNAFSSNQGQTFNKTNHAYHVGYNPYANQQPNGTQYIPEDTTFPEVDLGPNIHPEENAYIEALHVRPLDRFVGREGNPLKHELNANQVCTMAWGHYPNSTHLVSFRI